MPAEPMSAERLVMISRAIEGRRDHISDRRALVAEVDRLAGMARDLTAERDEARAELRQAAAFGRGEFRVTSHAYEQVCRVMYEAKADRDTARADLAALRERFTEVLGWFHEPGHPGRPCHRTGWVSDRELAELREFVAGPSDEPATPDAATTEGATT